jgi:hypothetical protein
MNSTTLRQLWSVIEETQTPTLLNLNDSDLTQQLLHQVQNKYVLSREDLQAVHHYLGDRLSLIRDMSPGANALHLKA